MTMRGYFDVFPKRTTNELRTAEFRNDDPHDSLAGGTFVFTEFFCTDPHCDCQRVLIKVFRPKSVDDANPEEVATISYSWNPNADEIWSVLNSDMPNPFLDPFHRQATYASELLDFWIAMIERDSAYALRIERHYDEIRAEVGTSTAKSAQPYSARCVVKKSSSRRPRTKRERMARKKLLARTRKRK